ncbi:MAG: amino acid ABC transporter permease, partial [Candidatus Onthovivens sp.]|nr:amino acid ABC transporter permease [Candidatus Onthovivens sp.]
TFLEGLAATLILALFGTFVGLLLGIIFALIKDIKIKEDDNKVVIFFKKLLKGFISLYVNVFRGTPMMVQAMIIYFGTDVIFNWSKIESFSFFTGAFWCGLFVITINTGAYMTEIVRSGLNGVDKGQLEAAKALGFSYSRSMTYVIIPQAIRNSLPTILNELVVNIKDSSVLNVIGVTELYLSVSIATNKNYFIVEGYIIIAIIYLLLTLIASYVTKLISRKLDGKKVFKLSLFKHYKPKLIEEE